jgi:hypothetical protein
MKLALAILAAVLMLAGCGHSQDPFAGTWQATGSLPGNGMVIARVANRYLVFITDSHLQVGLYWMVRHSNRLKETHEVPNPLRPAKPWHVVEVLDSNPANGHLTWTENGRAAIDLNKVSDSTVSPTPMPTTSP